MAVALQTAQELQDDVARRTTRKSHRRRRTELRPTKVMTFRVREDVAAELHTLADRERIAPVQVLEKAIEMYASPEGRRARVADLADQLLLELAAKAKGTK